MPFSATKSCTEAEWTHVFEEVLKPAIENAGLGYVCRRSEANRGNIVAGIIRDLNDSYVVLADLTDRNANVFYELGVRHALRNRTIIIAQRREDLPFDLRNYASHVYDWRSDEGRQGFREKIAQLLREVDTNPDRPDNPVTDFLQETSQPTSATNSTSNSGAPTAGSLFTLASESEDPIAAMRALARNGSLRTARTIYRSTRPELVTNVESTVGMLNQRQTGSMPESQIPSVAQTFISEGEPWIVPIEQFGLVSVQENWIDGVSDCMSFAGNLISVSETLKPGRIIRFATGLPSLLALRLLALMGAIALSEENFDALELIVRHPIEVERNGTFTHLSFLDRENLFYSEAFVGYANHTFLYLRDLWQRQPHLRSFFSSEVDFHFQVGQFLMVMALASAASIPSDTFRTLYPGYRLFPQARRAISALCSRLVSVVPYRERLAQIILKENGEVLKQKWESLAKRLNDAPLGEMYWHVSEAFFPASLDSEALKQARG